MPLDVYVGPLTLYYADRWENRAQAAARVAGHTYHKLRPNEASDTVRDPEQIRPTMIGWQLRLGEALEAHLPQPLAWSEAGQTYFSDRPDFEGLNALVLWAAYADHPDLPPPHRHGALADDPAYLRAASKDGKSSYPAIVRDIEFWLPAVFSFDFRAEAPHGDEALFSSVFALRQQLQELNDRTWKAGSGEVSGWGQTWPGDDAPFDELARFGFATMYRMATLACEHRLPMKLDY